MSFKYEIESYSADSKSSSGHLILKDVKYAASSGPFGNGSLPLGEYTVKTKNVVVGDTLDAAYCVTDTVGKLCFFIPLEPTFSTSRDGFGIHPDGNVPGSLGCIALPSTSYRKFWEAWLKIPLNERPTSLEVVKAAATA